jgi:hypothetical protein
MHSDRDRALALQCMQDGSLWKGAKLREGHSFAINNAFSFNIPLDIYDPSAHNFGGYRRDDARSTNIFSMLMFFVHLAELAVKEVCTSTTALDKGDAGRSESANEDPGVFVPLPGFPGAFLRQQQPFDGAASPVSSITDSPATASFHDSGACARRPLGGLVATTSALPSTPDTIIDGERIVTSQPSLSFNESDLSMEIDTLLADFQDDPGCISSTGEEEPNWTPPEATDVATLPLQTPAERNISLITPSIEPTTRLMPAIYVLLEQVPREGHRVPGEGKLHVLLDMLQERAPCCYTLHVLVCGVDFGALMARSLAINTLKTRDLPIFSSSYAENQCKNLFMRLGVADIPGEDHQLVEARTSNYRGRGGNRRVQRGRGRGGGRGARRGRNANEDAADDADRTQAAHDEEQEAEEDNNSQQLWSMEVSKRRRISSMSQVAPKTREPWEQHDLVTFDTIGGIYADMFNGLQNANRYQAQAPARMMRLAYDNPCHPQNMFSSASALLSRGPLVSHTQSLEFYARHHQQWNEERKLQSLEQRFGHDANRHTERRERDALQLAPRCPYMPRHAEVAAADGRAAIYTWTPPPGTADRFLGLNLTEVTCSMICNKILPHRQSYESVLVRAWPGLFGPRAKRVGSKQNSAYDDTMHLLGGDTEEAADDGNLYSLFPSTLRNNLHSERLVEFGPQVSCPMVDGEAMSIEHVSRLVHLMTRFPTVQDAIEEIERIKTRMKALSSKIQKLGNSDYVQQERARRQSVVLDRDGNQDLSMRLERQSHALASGANDGHEDDSFDSDSNDDMSEQGPYVLNRSGGNSTYQLDNPMSSSGFSFAQYDRGGSFNRRSSVDEIDSDDENASPSGHLLEQRDVTMGFPESDPILDRRTFSAMSRTSRSGEFPRNMFRSILDDNEHSDFDNRMILEPSSRSMPALGVEVSAPIDRSSLARSHSRIHLAELIQQDENSRSRAMQAAALISSGQNALSDASLRAQRMQQMNVSHSDSHLVRVNSRALREQLERLEATLVDMQLLSRGVIRAQLVEAKRLYEYQLETQDKWLKSVRSLASMCGANKDALPFADTSESSNTNNASQQQRAMLALANASSISELEHVMAQAPAPSRANNPILLLRGFYARKDGERTGQILVDMGETQGRLWSQLNARLMENASRIKSLDRRTWTLICERSACREFQERINDPNSNIPMALSVVLECAQTKQLNRRVGRMMHSRLDARMGVMQNQMAWLLEVYNAIFCIAKCELTLIGWISSQCATHHANELHPNLLVMGDAAASKTFPLAVLSLLRCYLSLRDPRKTTMECTRATERSSSHDGRHMMDYLVTIFNEVLKSDLVGDPLEGSTGSSVIKQVLDHCESFVQSLVRNPDTNKFEAVERFASCIGVRLMCGNWSMVELPMPILTRVILIPCMQSRGPRNNIAQAMARRQEQGASDQTKVKEVERYHNFLHYVQALTDAMITCGTMKNVNMWLVSFVITYINQELKKRSMPTIQPRFIQHIFSWVRAVVKQTVLAREFSYIGGIFQAHDVTPERIQLLQPYLYATMSNVVFVLGMLSRYSTMQGEDDMRTAIHSIVNQQREKLKMGLDNTRTFDDMFRVKGYHRPTAPPSTANNIPMHFNNIADERPSSPRPMSGIDTVRTEMRQFSAQVTVNDLANSNFVELDGEDSSSGFYGRPTNGEASMEAPTSNFPGLHEQLCQNAPVASRGIFAGQPTNTAAAADSIRFAEDRDANNQYHFIAPNNGNAYGNRPVDRDYRYLTFRLRSLGDGAGFKASQKQQACSQGAKRFMPILNENKSNVTEDMLSVLLMTLSEQFIKSPHYFLDANNEVRVRPGGQMENIRVVEFEQGLMHISYCWLLMMNVSTTKVVREILTKLNSYRYQPYEMCLWQHNEMFPNTFETIEIGHVDCEHAKYEELILENPAFYSDDELYVLYSDEELVHHKSKKVPLMRVDSSLNMLAAQKRSEELSWHDDYITERTMARVLYTQAESTFGADRTSEYHNCSFDPSDFAHLDDTICLQMPDCYYHVPNTAWTSDSPASVPPTMAHWDVLLSDEKNVEERRRIYCQLSYFTSTEVVNDRLSRWEKYVGRKYVNYPQALQQRFMPRATEFAVDAGDASTIRNLLEEELSNQSGYILSPEEMKLLSKRRDSARDSMAKLRAAATVVN